MTEKRFTKYVPDSYGYTYITTIIDNEKNKQTGNTDEIVDMLNDLSEENKQLKKLLECSRKEANDYCEELMGKDEFIRLYKSQRDDAIKENEQLKKILNELSDMLQFDVENGIRSYPVKLSEYLSNALKELQE